jgi:hypothetical protein
MSKNQSDSAQNVGTGCFILFGLPFFAAGLGVFLWAMSMFYTYFISANWEKVPAKIIYAKIVSSRSSKSTTYALKGEYEYTYKNKKYKGNRITVETGSSSGYKGKAKLCEILTEAQKENKSVPIYVDPSNPGDSLVFRKITTTMIILPIFGFVFMTVGGGIICLGLWGLYEQKRENKLLARYPNKPWKADSRWNGFNIKSENWHKMVIGWGISLFFTAFISMFVIALTSDKDAPLFAWGIISIFILITLFLWKKAISATIRYKKFGNALLIINQFPITPGSEFTAALVMPSLLKSGQPIHLDLKLEKTTTTGSGKNRSSHTNVVSSDPQTVQVQYDHFKKNKVIVPVSFKIPQSAQVDKKGDLLKYEWKITAKIPVPGVDFEAEFPIPVFKVSDPSLIEYKS